MDVGANASQLHSLSSIWIKAVVDDVPVLLKHVQPISHLAEYMISSCALDEAVDGSQDEALGLLCLLACHLRGQQSHMLISVTCWHRSCDVSKVHPSSHVLSSVFSSSFVCCQGSWLSPWTKQRILPGTPH